MSSKQPHRLLTKELDQLNLYTYWPYFEYYRASYLTGEKRDVTPKSPHAGAQYLLIDDRSFNDPNSGLLGYPGTYPIGCSMPDRLLYHHNHLASELIRIFLFLTGRAYEDKQSAALKQDWSQVVWDLIGIGLKKAFNRKNSGRYGSPRIAGAAQLLTDGDSFNQASSSNCYTTAVDVLGLHEASALFRVQGDVPPNIRDIGDNVREPEEGVSLIVIETSEQSNEE